MSTNDRNDYDDDYGDQSGQGTAALMKLASEQAAPLMRRDSAAAGALEAQARAQEEGRFILARRFPRSIVVAEQKLLEDCKRPGFAEKARYKLPFGEKKAEGYSIRFAEAAALAFGNISAFSHVVAEDEESITIRAGAIDYESNIDWHSDVRVSKTVERRQLRKGQKPRGQRVNSFGDVVYIVDASDQELAREVAKATSIACRTAILRMVPRDVQDTCLAQIYATQTAEVKKDPREAQRKLVAAFSELGISAEGLTRYVGHNLDDGLTPDEIVELREVYTGLKEGFAKWGDVLAAKTGAAPDGDGKPNAIDDLKAKVAERARKKRAASAAQAAPEQAAPAQDPKPAVRAPGEEG